MPRIVVLMGAYNEEAYLRETMWAVLNQTMGDFGFLLHDNGSTDGSASLMLAAYDEDDRIDIITSNRNLPPGRAMNRGMTKAHELWPDCEWFVTAGADDVMERDYLEAILRAADARPDANLIFSPWQWIGHPDRGVKVFPTFDPETCHGVHQVPAWAAIRRDLWSASGEHDETMIAADWDWVVRNRHAIRAYQLDRPYISLRVREGARVTQSEEVHWPSLHRRFCEMVGKPVPAWATNAHKVC